MNGRSKNEEEYSSHISIVKSFDKLKFSQILFTWNASSKLKSIQRVQEPLNKEFLENRPDPYCDDKSPKKLWLATANRKKTKNITVN